MVDNAIIYYSNYVCIDVTLPHKLLMTLPCCGIVGAVGDCCVGVAVSVYCRDVDVLLLISVPMIISNRGNTKGFEPQKPGKTPLICK